MESSSDAGRRRNYLLAGKALEKFQALYRAHWLERSKGKVDRELQINIVRDRNRMAAIIDQLGHSDNTWNLIDYYFATYNNPDLTWFFFNYEKVLEMKKWEEEDTERLERLRQETKQRVLKVVKGE